VGSVVRVVSTRLCSKVAHVIVARLTLDVSVVVGTANMLLDAGGSVWHLVAITRLRAVAVNVALNVALGEGLRSVGRRLSKTPLFARRRTIYSIAALEVYKRHGSFLFLGWSRGGPHSILHGKLV